MKLPKWLPDPEAWLDAVALYFFGMGAMFVFSIALPFLLELVERWPRLGWLGILLVWLSPIPAAAAIHSFVHSILDAGGRERTPRHSLFAGLFAWMTWLFTTIVASFIMLVLDPPPSEPPDGAFLMTLQRTSTLSVFALVWIVVAAFVYRIERQSRTP